MMGNFFKNLGKNNTDDSDTGSGDLPSNYSWWWQDNPAGFNASEGLPDLPNINDMFNMTWWEYMHN
jgi:hypothetical protein